MAFVSMPYRCLIAFASSSSVSKLTEGKTLIVIAHRLSTVMDADKIFVIKDGRIDDAGTHAELLSHHGLYETMWKAHMEVKDNG